MRRRFTSKGKPGSRANEFIRQNEWKIYIEYPMDIVCRRFTSLVARKRKGNLDLARTKIRIEYPTDIVYIFGLWREKNLFHKYRLIGAREKGEIHSHRSDLSSILLFRTEIDSNL